MNDLSPVLFPTSSARRRIVLMADLTNSWFRSILLAFLLALNSETIATLPGGWDLAHAIRLGIKLFAELGANSQALSESHVDSPCSCRAIFESAPVAMLQSLKKGGLSMAIATDGLQNALHITARVQSGNKIEITAPGLQEGQDVDVYLVPRPSETPSRRSVLEFLDSLPSGPRSAPTWDEVERRFQEERDAWDR